MSLSQQQLEEKEAERIALQESIKRLMEEQEGDSEKDGPKTVYIPIPPLHQLKKVAVVLKPKVV